MAEGKMHFAPILALDPRDHVVIDNLLLEVVNTPREEIKDGIARVVGKTASHVSHHSVEVATAISTEQMVPRLDDDFNMDTYDIDNGQVLTRDEWPDLPVIFVDLAREVRYTDAFGNCKVEEVSGFYVRRTHGQDGFHTYLSLDGQSELDQSAGDRIIKWRKATPTDFVAEQEKTNE